MRESWNFRISFTPFISYMSMILSFCCAFGGKICIFLTHEDISFPHVMKTISLKFAE